MQLTLEGQTKDQVAIERIRMFEPPEGYYGAFSGGKDSVSLYRATTEAGVRVDWHYHLAVEAPEVVQFVRQNYPDVQMHIPEKSMWRLIDEHGTLPTRQVRFCCEDLKEIGGRGRLVLTGIRWAESPRRATRKMLETDKRRRDKSYLHPLIDWTDDDVWGFIREKHIHPLQLDVIERCIVLWSNPGETVLTPFMGVGSEVYAAVQLGRKGVGIELKPSYFKQAVKNLASVQQKVEVGRLL